MNYYGKPAYALALSQDEPARSWLLRNACLAGVGPDVMDQHLRNMGVLQIRFRRDLIQIPPEAEWAGGGARPPLASYCPLCFANDLRAGTLPHFRAKHHDPFLTHCPMGSPQKTENKAR